MVEEARGTMPWPPSANQIYRATNGRVIKSKKYRAWIQHATAHLLAEGIEKVPPPYQVEITLIPPDKRRFDIDNRLKSVLDILQKSDILEDDCFIDDLRVVRGQPDREGSHAHYVVRSLSE